MLTLSGTPDFTPFREFMILLIRNNVHYVLLNLSVLGLCLRINDSGLFAWISLAALARTYCIMLYIYILQYYLKIYLQFSERFTS